MAYNVSIKYGATEIGSITNADNTNIIYNCQTISSTFIGTKTLNCSGKLFNNNISVISTQAGYNYGDGSKNTVANGYEGLLYVNGKTASYNLVSSYMSNATNYRINDWGDYSRTSAEKYIQFAVNRAYTIAKGGSPSDISGLTDSQYKYLDNKGTIHKTFQAGVASTNTATFDTNISGEKTVVTYWEYGSLTTGINIGAIKYCINGTYYTPQQMVSNNIVKPLVLIDSHGVNGSYYYSNFLNIYSGGTSNTGNYPGARIHFMLNSGYTISAVQWYANKARGSTSYNDGLQYVMSFNISDFRYTLNSY